MKEFVVNKSLNLIKKKYNYTDVEYEKITYGLEVLYLGISKILVIYLVSFLFGCIKETLIFSIFIAPLRSFSYGIHAKKSWHCYISSLIAFILFPYLFVKFSIPLILKILICIFTIISMILFAPADTHKRPIVNKKMREKLKIKALAVSLIYIGIVFIYKNEFVTNIILLAMIVQSIVINPITYKLFNLPYNNYKEYLK